MSKPVKAIPTFRSEAQERAFLGTPRLGGACRLGPCEKSTFPNLKPITKTISLRLPQHLLDEIMTVANARDLPYQSLIKVWLQEKLGA